MLESYLRSRLEQRELLLMTHIVLGYPSFDDSLRLIEAMVESGVDLMELQIPFSEPIADGPVILQANQRALENGATVAKAFEFAAEATRRFDIPLLFMSYYNILFKRGTRQFVSQMAEVGLRGAIVPDLPPEEASEYLAAMSEHELAPIFIFSPNSTSQRMATIAQDARGFIYCVARKGVTGQDTDFTSELGSYLTRCRAATSLPRAVGFGVRSAKDIGFLRGKAEIAVVGSQTLRLYDERGLSSIGPFLRSLVA